MSVTDLPSASFYARRVFGALMDPDEPEVEGVPISEKMTRDSYEEARRAYRLSANGAFDVEREGEDPPVVGLARRLDELRGQLKTLKLDPQPFSEGEWEHWSALLRLRTAVFCGEYAWRGTGGNMPGNPSFDADLVPESCPETELREALIVATINYCQAAAAVANELGSPKACEAFADVASRLDASGRDDEADGEFTHADVEAMRLAFLEGQRLLYGVARAHAETPRRAEPRKRAESAKMPPELEERLDAIEIMLSRVGRCFKSAGDKGTVRDPRVKKICYDLWRHNRFNEMVLPESAEPGTVITKRLVFEHFKKQLARYDITTVEAFERAVDAGRHAK